MPFTGPGNPQKIYKLPKARGLTRPHSFRNEWTHARPPKRRLSNVAYARTVADQSRDEAGPGGRSGTTLQSGVTGLTPDIGSSDKPLPGPATSQPTRRPNGVLT